MIRDEFGLSGRVAVVTGANRGLAGAQRRAQAENFYMETDMNVALIN